MNGLYQASTLGRIKSLERYKQNHSKLEVVSEKILKQYKDRNGYMKVYLYKGGKRKILRTHRIIAETFIDNPNALPCVNHLDYNRQNNRVDNLEYCTYKCNNIYSKLYDKTSKKILQYDLQGNFLKEWNSTMEIERVLNLAHNNISSCCKQKPHCKTVGGYIWRYKDII